MWKMLVRAALALVILGVSVAITLGLVNGNNGEATDPVMAAGADVTALAVTPGEYRRQANWTGEVRARRQVEVTAPVAADVLALPFQEGDRAAQGDVLLRLDTQEVIWDVRQAQSELRDLELNRNQTVDQYETDQAMLDLERSLLQQAERAVTRERDLRGRGATTEAALDDAEARLAQVQQSVQQMQSALAQHDNNLARLATQEERIAITLERLQTLRDRSEPEAPFAATVAAVPVTENQRVAAGQNLLSLYAHDSLVWQAYLPADAPSGLEARLAGRWVPLARRSAQVNEGASSRRGEFPLPETMNWVPGETHTVTVAWPPRANLQLIPASSLYSGNRVFLVDGEGRLSAVAIAPQGTTELNGDEYWLADADHFPPDGRILVTRLPNALNGLTVNVTETRTAPAGE